MRRRRGDLMDRLGWGLVVLLAVLCAFEVYMAVRVHQEVKRILDDSKR